MSYPFEMEGETLWDAGYHSGRLFASLAHGAAEFLELPSGLTPSDQGGCDVDPEQFRVFVEGLHELYASTRNEVLHGLSHGLLATSLVLLERAGGTVALTPPHAATLVEEKALLAHSMGVQA
ncbi:DUF6086 family protein [Streptomyces sp. NPDC058423]|uniref:DUF6086 family protein n=1 Tax=unclassified Streptomyces TaxID=2593676 RepID=UPI00365B2347